MDLPSTLSPLSPPHQLLKVLGNQEMPSLLHCLTSPDSYHLISPPTPSFNSLNLLGQLWNDLVEI